jgi:type IV secretion system protein VirB8
MKDSDNNISWDKDLYHRAIAQKNVMTLLTLILAAGIIISLIWLKISMGENKVEPFVIEIDSKSGLATTVNPVTISEYSANIAVVRSLIIQYIKAREEYILPLYDKNFNTVRVLSDPIVYREYSRNFGSGNPSSPYNVLNKYGSINVVWKSIIFPQKNTAQVRISLETRDTGNNPRSVDRIILMSFDFKPDNKISEADRIINPLGFIVTMYKIEDENPNI